MAIVRPPIATIAHTVAVHIPVITISDTVIVEVAVIAIRNAVAVQVAAATAVIHAIAVAVDPAARFNVAPVPSIRRTRCIRIAWAILTIARVAVMSAIVNICWCRYMAANGHMDTGLCGGGKGQHSGCTKGGKDCNAKKAFHVRSPVESSMGQI